MMEIPRIEVKSGSNKSIIRKYNKKQNRDGSFTLKLNEKYEHYRQKGEAFMSFGDDSFTIKKVKPLVIPDKRVRYVEGEGKGLDIKEGITSTLTRIKEKSEEKD